MLCRLDIQRGSFERLQRAAALPSRSESPSHDSFVQCEAHSRCTKLCKSILWGSC